MRETAVEITDAECWAALVAGSPAGDVYYAPEYARATAEIEGSEPLAVVAGLDSCRLLAPLLVRRMSAEGKWVVDAASPYGYGGLLSLSGSQPSADELRGFFDGLRDWCSAKEIVCCVIRLHPLMRQIEWFSLECGMIRPQIRGTTIAIDLSDWDDTHDRPKGMRKGRESDLNAARRTLRVRWTSGQDADIERFTALYDEAMQVRGGDKFYRFPRSYFSRLADMGQQCRMVSAWMGDEFAGASIFLLGGDYAHYHLAAVNKTGTRYKASTLLVVEGARWAKESGCKVLHLGGGLRPGDSLEDFKRSFGGQQYHYAYLTFVVDPVRYDELCRMPNAPWPYRMNRGQDPRL